MSNPTQEISSTSLPLRAIEGDFVEATSAAAKQRATVSAFVKNALAGGIASIVFVGTGGSLASSMHAVHTLKQRVTDLYIDNISSAEVLAAMPERIGPSTLVIASSHSGATPETVAATTLIKQTGATVITLSSSADTPLGRLGDLPLSYNSDRTITSPKQILLSHITWAVLARTAREEELSAVAAAYDALPTALRHTLDEADEQLAAAARDLAGNPFVYVLSSGPNYGAGYLLSMCYLIEMQWTRSACFSAGEFFHGAFELAVPESAVVILQGEDSTRLITERAARFADLYSDHAHLLDTRDFSLPGISDELRHEVTPIVLGVLASRLADHLEAATGHSLDERRYMYKVEY